MTEANENMIDFLRNEETATVTFSQGRFINQMRELAERFPEEVQVLREPEENGGYLLAKIPVRYIKIRPPMQMSQERRDALAERARVNFHGQAQDPDPEP